MDKHELNLSVNDIFTGKGSQLEIMADYTIMIDKIAEQSALIEMLGEAFIHSNNIHTTLCDACGGYKCTCGADEALSAFTLWKKENGK